MDANRIVSMIVRIVTRQLLNRGIRAGMDRIGRPRGTTVARSDEHPQRKPAERAQGAPDDRPQEMSEADRDQARRARETAKTARKAMRLTRRMGRF